MAMVWLEVCPTMILPKFTEVGLTEMLMVGGSPLTPEPFKGRLTGLLWFLALCVIDKVPENVPAAVGENRTTTDFD